MTNIDYPPGWSSERLNTISSDDFSQIPEEERVALKKAIRKHAFSPEYTTLQKLNKTLSSAAARPCTPPSYVPPGWTVEQAKGLDMRLVTKLSEEEQRLWAAGKCADTTRRARKTGNQAAAAAPPSYIPAGWSVEQGASPTFEILSQLSQEELTRYMQSRNELMMVASSATMPSSVTTTSGATQGSNPPLPPPPLPSPLIQALQKRGYPAWGFVVVRTYYASEERWQAFQERLDTLCVAQLDQETGPGLQDVKDTLQLKMIEDPRLQGASHAEARKHFRAALAMGGVAAGLDLDILLLADQDAVDSVLDHEDSLSASSGALSPYLVAVDVREELVEQGSGGYPGFFRVSVDALLSELYPKLCMGLSASDLWAVLDDGQVLWTGDEE
ncbi:hypothetical protein MGN70_008673 [Eutypa lata]|nr:hypothetical protein MGN70_008673 [Eutypa lata]